MKKENKKALKNDRSNFKELTLKELKTINGGNIIEIIDPTSDRSGTIIRH